jgi:hypothetical protein
MSPAVSGPPSAAPRDHRDFLAIPDFSARELAGLFDADEGVVRGGDLPARRPCPVPVAA